MMVNSNMDKKAFVNLEVNKLLYLGTLMKKKKKKKKRFKYIRET